MDARRKWDVGYGFSDEKNHSDKKKRLQAVNLMFNPQSVKQFYQFHLHEKTWTNGNLHRNEIKKLVHITLNQDSNGINHIQIESFDRKHLNRELAISEKEFIAKVSSILDDVSLDVNQYGKEFLLKNEKGIQSKFKSVLEKLQKNYVGINAERQFRFLKTFYSNSNLVLKDLLRYKNYGLLLPKFYGFYDAGQIRTETVRYSNLIEKNLISIQEEASIFSIDEDQIAMNITGSFDEKTNVNACKLILTNRKIPYSETDLPKLELYEGRFEFERTSGLVKNSQLNIAFTFGNAYRKEIDYTLKNISYEEA